MNSADPFTKGVGVFFLWCSRFGIKGSATDRSMTAMFVTAILLGGLLFTTANILSFCIVGTGFLKWYAASLPCTTSYSFLCHYKWAIVFLFLVPGVIFAIAVKQRYALLVGPKASGVEYIYSLLFFFIMYSTWIVGNNLIYTLLSSAIYFTFFIFLMLKAKSGVSSRNIWRRNNGIRDSFPSGS